MDLRNGMLVKHASLGLGKVVALEASAAHVVFPDHDARLATKLRLPMALSFLVPSPESGGRLSGLTGFALDEETGRYVRATVWLSHEEAVERFRQDYPEAFEDPAYLEADGPRASRAARWRRAAAEYEALLGDGKGDRMLEDGDLPGLVDALRKVERHLKGMQREAERLPLKCLLADPATSAAYWKAALEFVAVSRPHRGKFEALARAVAKLDVEGGAEGAWRMITFLPFVARPDLHAELRPRFAREAAQRLGMDLAYEAEPNWTTYASLLALHGALLERLAPLGARDHVDVDAFLHVALTKPARPKEGAPVTRSGRPAGRR